MRTFSIGWVTSDIGRELTATVITIALALAVALALWEMAGLYMESYLARAEMHGEPEEKRARIRTMMPLARNALLVVLVIIVGLVVLAQLGINIAPLLAGAGIVGLAVGFGAQKMVQDVFTGMFEGQDSRTVIEWFDLGGSLPLSDSSPAADVVSQAEGVQGLRELAGHVGLKANAPAPLVAAAVDFVLEGLYAQRKISRNDERGYSAAPEAAGRGAAEHVPAEMIRAVRAAIDIPLVVGGGIRTAEAAGAVARAGADVVVTGTVVEREKDGEALRREKVRRELAAEQKVTLAPREEPGPAAFDNAKTQRALEKLMTARAGKDTMAQFTADFEQKAGRKASRGNPALALFGKGSDDREFYEALYRRLVELHPLPDAELQALGQQRAAAVSQALVKDAGVDAARVALGESEAAGEAPQNTIETRLRLDVLGAKP